MDILLLPFFFHKFRSLFVPSSALKCLQYTRVSGCAVVPRKHLCVTSNVSLHIIFEYSQLVFRVSEQHACMFWLPVFSCETLMKAIHFFSSCKG